MSELSRRSEAIVNNKTFVDTLDSDWRRARHSWHRELAESSLMEWLEMRRAGGVACWSSAVAAAAAGSDTVRGCGLVAALVEAERRTSDGWWSASAAAADWPDWARRASDCWWRGLRRSPPDWLDVVEVALSSAAVAREAPHWAAVEIAI